MRAPKVVLAIAIALCAVEFWLSRPASAWVSIGPDGGSIVAIVVDPTTPTTIYAAVYAGPNAGDGRGVFKSVDGGATWQDSSGGDLVDSAVARLVMHPNNPQRLYALIYSGGFSRTVNGGGTWSGAGSGLPGGQSSDLVIDPIDPNTFYVGTGNGVYKSTNAATSFFPSNTGLTQLVIFALAIDPSNPAILYASTVDGVFKSTDGAATWAPSTTGLPPNPIPAILVVDPAVPSTIYAAECTLGVYRSIDGGANWSPVSTGLPNAAACVQGLAANPAAPGTLYVAATDDGSQTVFKSTDYGSTWSPAAGGLEGRVIQNFAFDPVDPQLVYAGGQSGFFKTTDGGTNWNLSMTGIRHPYLVTVAVDPSAPATIYAAGSSDGRGSVVKTTDGGASWAHVGPRSCFPVSPNALIEHDVRQVVIDPVDSSRIWVGGDRGVFRSDDGGATWNCGQVQNFGDVQWLAVDPLAPSTVYVTTYGAGVQKSTDAGATWTVMNNGIPAPYAASIVVDPQHAGTLYASAAFRGVFKSIDGAANWTAVNTGFSNPNFTGFSNLVMDPVDPSILYVEANGFFRTTNGGASWTGTSGVGGSPLLGSPVDPNTIFGVDGLQVQKTTDAGATWSIISAAGVQSYIQNIAIDPTTGATLYAATLEGVLKSGTGTGLCTSDADCNDGERCTTDSCDPGAPGADIGTGCVYAPVVCGTGCHDDAGFCDDTTGMCVYGTPAKPDGTPCNDGDLCTFDRCIDGTCVGNPVPDVACHAAPSTRFLMRRGTTPDRNTLTWQWKRGESSFSDLGNPLISSEYALCVYDRSGPGGASANVVRMTAPVGQVQCGTHTCWQISGGHAFKFRDRTASYDGLLSILMHSGLPTKAKVVVKGRGSQLPSPPLPLTPKLTVQMKWKFGNDGDCWSAEYDGTQVRRNDSSGVKAATP